MNIACVSSVANDLGESPYRDVDVLDEAERRAQPLAGHVFAIEGLGARGLPEQRFGA